MNLLSPEVEHLDLDSVLKSFSEKGFARLGRVLTDAALESLRERTDDLMLGRVVYDGMFFQHDSETGRYEDLVRKQGYVGPSLDYRKLEKLELDDRFRSLLENRLYERIARAIIDEPEITIYRATLFCKSARGGSEIPWHQDAGRFWGLDRDPVLQIWTALDDAAAEAGCVEVLPQTHLDGLATPLGGIVPEPLVRAREERIRAANDPGLAPHLLPAKAGEALLIHNHVWHRSQHNTTGKPRRAVTICYMPGSVRCTRKKRAPRVFYRAFAR